MRKLGIQGLMLWVLFCFLVSRMSWGDIIISDAPGNQTRPQVVWGGEKYLVVWNDSRSGQTDIYAQFVDSCGNLIDTNFRPVPEPYEKHICDICPSDSNYFILFHTSDLINLYGSIVSFEGIPIGVSFLIADTNALGQVEWNREKYLVATNPIGGIVIGQFFQEMELL